MPIQRPVISFLNEQGSRDGSSFRFTYGPDEITATAKFFVPWEQRFDAVSYFLGYSRIVGTALERLTPVRVPEDESMYATRVTSITGHRFTTSRTSAFLPGARLNQFEQAEMEVMFETVPFDVAEDADVAAEYERFTSIGQPKASADYLMLPGGVMLYAKQGGGHPTELAIPFNIGKILPIVEFEILWHQLPRALFDPLSGDFPSAWFERIFGDGTQRPLLGCVNSEMFLGFPPGTILFSAIEPRPRKFPVQAVAWDMAFTFAYDPNKWNFKYYWPTDPTKAGFSGWYFVSKDGSFFEPGVDALPDDTSIYSERPLATAFEVG